MTEEDFARGRVLGGKALASTEWASLDAIKARLASPDGYDAGVAVDDVEMLVGMVEQLQTSSRETERLSAVMAEYQRSVLDTQGMHPDEMESLVNLLNSRLPDTRMEMSLTCVRSLAVRLHEVAQRLVGQQEENQKLQTELEQAREGIDLAYSAAQGATREACAQIVEEERKRVVAAVDPSGTTMEAKVSRMFTRMLDRLTHSIREGGTV